MNVKFVTLNALIKAIMTRCMNSNTRENEKYFKLSKAATDGEKDGNIAKVIRKVAKNVIIDK